MFISIHFIYWIGNILKVEKDLTVDSTASDAPQLPTKRKSQKKTNDLQATDTASTQRQTTPVSPVTLPTTSQNPLTTPRASAATVTVAPLIQRKARTSAPREAGTAPTLRVDGSNGVTPSSAPASVTEGGAQWQNRKTIAAGGQSVEQMLSILERRRPTKALSAPTKVMEAEDEESEGHSSDENELRLDAVEGSMSDVTSEDSNPFESGRDNSGDSKDDADDVDDEEEAEDDDGQTVQEKMSLPLPSNTRKSSKAGRAKVANEVVISKAPSNNKVKKASGPKKKVVATGVTKRVPVDKSESSTVNASSFYVTPKAKEKPQPMRASARRSRASTKNPK